MGYSYWNAFNNKPKNSALQHISQNDVQQLADYLISVVEKQNPKVAMDFLEEKANGNDEIASECYLIAHSVGRKAYERYQDFGQAVQYLSDVCSLGYLHGVIEGYFSSSKNFTTLMKTVCQKYRLGSFSAAECFHGIGHAVMYTNENNLPLSLVICDTYAQDVGRSECLTGVFMENFITDSKLHPSKYLRMDDPFYPCNTQPDKYKWNCYVGIPLYYLHTNKKAYKELLAFCLTAEANYRNFCTFGAGGQFIKEHMSRPHVAEKLCNLGTNMQKNLCISGMIGYYMYAVKKLLPAREFCTQLEVSSKSTCEAFIRNNLQRFES